MPEITITPDELVAHYNNRLLQHIDDVAVILNNLNRLVIDIESCWISSSADSATYKLQQINAELDTVSSNLKEAKSLLAEIKQL